MTFKRTLVATFLASQSLRTVSAAPLLEERTLCVPGPYIAQDGAVYNKQCGFSYNGNGGSPGVKDRWIGTVSNVGSVNACAEACESHRAQGCLAADYDEGQQTCIMLSAVDNGSTTNSGGGDAVIRQSG